METINVAEISNLAKQWITDENFVIVILGPEKKIYTFLPKPKPKKFLKKKNIKK